MKKAATSKDYLTLDIGRLLGFYDELDREEKKELGSSVSALTGLLGEDVVLGALDKYLKEKIEKPINYACRGKMRTIRRKGKKPKRSNSWLDAWIVLPKKCYQTEVKNWSASAISGISLSPNCSHTELLQTAKTNLEHYLGEPRNTKKVWKVLKEMQKPPRKHVMPLLAFWSPVAPTSASTGRNLRPMFEKRITPYLPQIEEAKIEINGFKTVTVFSASLYLRDLKRRGIKKVRLYMPRAARRLLLLSDIGLKL